MYSREIEDTKKRLKLTPRQREIIVGLLLGDGCLERTGKGSTYRLKVEQSAKHKPYVDHLYEEFRQWVQTPPRKRVLKTNGGQEGNWTFQTVSHPSLKFYGTQFYKDGTKAVPKLIDHWITPIGLAYWFMDDGSMKSKDSKGVIFNTQDFSKAEVELLTRVLGTKFSLEASLRKQREGYQIYVSGRSYERFIELVEPYVIDEMRYKLPPPRRTQLPKL